MFTYQKALQWGIDLLQMAGIKEAQLTAELLCCAVSNIQRIELQLRLEQNINSEELDQYQQYIHRRVQHEPLEYIIGKTRFYGLDFDVNSFVLIPRPETELLVEIVTKDLDQALCNIQRIVDYGTGSGVIAIALAKRFPEKKVIGIDLSPGAISVAKRNALQNGCPNVSFFITQSIDDVITAEPFVLVANPPYIPSAEIETLEPEVKTFEPRMALDGGSDGLEHYRKMAQYYARDNNCRAVYLEVGYNQAADVQKIFEGTLQLQEIEILKDYAGIDRFVRIINK